MYSTEEHTLQVNIVNLLNKNKVKFFSVPNGLLRHIRVDITMKKEGQKAGVSDLVLLFPNAKTVFVEIKTPKGKQSDNQVEFESMVTKLGFEYYIIRSIREMELLISKIKA
jgi:hypothetical protein